MRHGLRKRRMVARVLAITFMVMAGCLPPGHTRNEIDLLIREARELHSDITALVVTSLKEASLISVDAVTTAFRQASVLDPAAIRFVATETACLIAKNAVTLVAYRQSGTLDKILDTDRSHAVISMFLSTCCYPAIDDLVRQAVDWQVNRRDPLFMGDTGAPDFTAILSMHLDRFSPGEALAAVKGFGTPKKTPEYFKAVARNRVATSAYGATRNWKDHGIVYQYRIAGDSLFLKQGDSAWHALSPLPFAGRPVAIAADNNRLLVQTDGHELWWYCARNDQAAWSIDIMKTAVAFMDLKPVVGEQVTGVLLPMLVGITDSTMRRAASLRYLESWKQRSMNDSSTLHYWKEKCSLWTDIALSVDRLLLKTGDGASFTAAQYAEWSKNAHKGGSWSNLLVWTHGSDTLTRGRNLAPERIGGIAIGNWNGTVITMYALAEGKVWFIDEEIIHPEWKPIERWNSGWVLAGQQQYHAIAGAPYPLDDNARIHASNSVVAVLSKKADTAVISWLRWDYHQKDDFIYWPLDWCNHAWRTVIAPGVPLTGFGISAIENIDPREKNTVWSIPAPAFTFHDYMPRQGYEGIFGDVPGSMVDAYPIDLFAGSADGTTWHFSAKRSETVHKAAVKWRKVR
ncbi:MAG: hypothetical protein JXA71_07485 [Chitinispirillaceae bacterium]|nr:hypothetical protein [Chitinispirillaceae bacterium]